MPLPAPVDAVTRCFLTEVDRRLPGRLGGLFLHGSLCWGEFFPGSDIDFLAVWDRLPTGADLDLLRAAHESTRARHPDRVFDGLHGTAADLAGSPALIDHRPAFFQGTFDPAGGAGLSLVTWHELAERAVTIRGELPPVHTDRPALLAYTRGNLDSYWRGAIAQVEDAGFDRLGRNESAVSWIALGVARLHHLLTRRVMTSKSGAGRYLLELDQRWAEIAREALRIRERPDTPSGYDDPGRRGQDTYDLLTWMVEDGVGRRP
ncbi:nucleotidyltransferase domain-containing protein [Microlunatus speluncae]|uniref:nucleotidyltransferase domain-containing protein n=1 Tax=Microlunatus speluncae TaxID=2594267 RepID=UPI0012667FCA|nr:nucleotidyltransferase domain-containing protein [Microlunatus speluncae]